jgi:hypothetical protein
MDDEWSRNENEHANIFGEREKQDISLVMGAWHQKTLSDLEIRIGSQLPSQLQSSIIRFAQINGSHSK